MIRRIWADASLDRGRLMNSAIKFPAALEEICVFCYNHMMYEYG